MVKPILLDAENRMNKAVEVVRDEFSKIRTGKATTALLDGVKVDYYGTMVPLKQVANVGTPDPHTVSVQAASSREKGVLLDVILNLVKN